MLKKIYKYTRSLDLYLLLCTVRISLSSSFPIHNSIWMNEWMNECLRSINLKILVWISSSSSSVHHPLSSLCGLFRCYTLYSIRLFSYGLATTLCIVDSSRAKWRRRRRGRRSNNTTYFLSTTDWQHARQITHLVRSIHDIERVCLCVCVCVSNKIINEYHAIASLSPLAVRFLLFVRSPALVWRVCTHIRTE